MDGPILKPKWARLIATGAKTLEIRGHRMHKFLEPFYILESGTGRAIGIAECEGNIPIPNGETWEHYKNEHLVDLPFAELPYKKVFGWRIQNAMPVEPFRLPNPRGILERRGKNCGVAEYDNAIVSVASVRNARLVGAKR